MNQTFHVGISLIINGFRTHLKTELCCVFSCAKLLLHFDLQFMIYGFFQCVDGFLFIFTFLPLRFIKAFLKFFVRGCFSSWYVSINNYIFLTTLKASDKLRGGLNIFLVVNKH